jgi:hypothetical protein
MVTLVEATTYTVSETTSSGVSAGLSGSFGKKDVWNLAAQLNLSYSVSKTAGEQKTSSKTLEAEAGFEGHPALNHSKKEIEVYERLLADEIYYNLFEWPCTWSDRRKRWQMGSQVRFAGERTLSRPYSIVGNPVDTPIEHVPCTCAPKISSGGSGGPGWLLPPDGGGGSTATREGDTADGMGTEKTDSSSPAFSQLASPAAVAQVAPIGTLRVLANDPRICVKGDNVVAAAIVSRDGTPKKELGRTADGQAHVIAYDRKEEDKDDKLVIIQTVAGGGVLATVFGLLSSGGSSGSGGSGETDTTPPLTAPSGARDAVRTGASPVIHAGSLEPVVIKGNSAAVSVEGTNLLGKNPEEIQATLESSKKIIYPNLLVATGAQNVAVFDRAFESNDIGERFDYVVRTSENSARGTLATVGLSRVIATPECVEATRESKSSPAVLRRRWA